MLITVCRNPLRVGAASTGVGLDPYNVLRKGKKKREGEREREERESANACVHHDSLLDSV